MAISALLTDFYELTMIQGYYLRDHNPQVVFDMFYRSQPFEGGYAIFTGLEDFLDMVLDMRFLEEDLEFLRQRGLFKEEFLEYLKDFSFTGSIHAMDEGTIMFPGEPIIRVHSTLIEAQIIESLLLNIINFQSLIATKASRVYLSSKRGRILEFGLRRAQGVDGALSASRAAFIGGAAGTSNTLAGRLYQIPVSGTMAHSWVMSYSSELESFRAFAETYPDTCILLIDTYDTLGTGIEHAITVGLEMKERGKRIGIRIDSGDLSYLSRKVRERLDEAGLTDATITVSNDLNEQIIELLVNDGAPIDAWGVGTHLVTGGDQSSMNGVYKLCAKYDAGKMEYIPTLKVSNTLEKTTNPGIKQVYRFYDASDNALADLITLEDEEILGDRTYRFLHPSNDSDYFLLRPSEYASIKPLLIERVHDGVRLTEERSLTDIKAQVQKELSHLHPSYLRHINPHVYKVSLSKRLKDLKRNLLERYREGYEG